MPNNAANQIQTDTTAVKNRIRLYKDIAKNKPYGEDSALNAEQNLKPLGGYLDKLRNMYKGNPIVVNEFEARKGAYDDYGYMNTSPTPFNALRNFTLKHDLKTGVNSYNDTYDFNQFESFLPGKKFEIKGAIK